MAETIKKSRRGRAAKADEFAQDEIEGEYAKPGPRVDPEAAAIAAAISEIRRRERTGFVEKWRPAWLLKALPNAQPFSLYFFDDKLVVDFINREQPAGAELDALADDMTPAQRSEVLAKAQACGEQGIRYMHLGPDDEMDKLQLAAKLGATICRKADRKALHQAPGGDGITEEELA
jgi:hypothetical protein